MKTRIIIVGGFLGAGKTTLLYETAGLFAKEGKQIGLITNDQAAGLVDTAYLEYTDSIVAEVNGSCFCCNFNGLTDAIEHIKTHGQIEIIIAEPVGSCTDLSATLIQPLKDYFQDNLIIAPLSVLIDPKQLKNLLNGGVSKLHSSAVYIISKQLEEADIIVINKTDLLNKEDANSLKIQAENTWPNATVVLVSSKNGEGLSNWLNKVTASDHAGLRLADVDYDIYAEGEAVLGWLNRTLILESENADWNNLAEKLLSNLCMRFEVENAEVGHVKIFIMQNQNYLIGNITGDKDTISLRGSVEAGGRVNLTLNARVQMDPVLLERIVKEEISKLCGSDVKETPLESKCLSPGRPNPTYRYDHIVD